METTRRIYGNFSDGHVNRAYYMSGAEAKRFVQKLRNEGDYPVEVFVSVQLSLAEKEEDGGTGLYEDDTYCADVATETVKCKITHKQFLQFCELVDSSDERGVLVETNNYPEYSLYEVTIGR
tara:strand:+ start:342 stop:707 length:366 start_codon:yes stop_codon:yes gene_type:complete